MGLFHTKTRETLRLRAWKDFLSLRFNAGQPIEYWVHVASQGELEYAIPILEELGRRQKQVLVTYYSISAKTSVEQLPLKFPNVSLVVPLPHDGLGLMQEFVRLVRKQGVRTLLLLKYELWPGVLWECNAQKIRVFLVDAIKPSWFHRKLIHKLDGILAGYHSELDTNLHKSAQVVGDTRVERVLSRVQASRNVLNHFLSPGIRDALGDPRQVIVCGSMWPKDSAVVFGGLKKLEKRPQLIWVPHELNFTHARWVRAQLLDLNYRILELNDQTEETLSENLSGESLAIIVMKKGLLAELYRLGKLAYVGGGFGRGVHSVWEPSIAGAFVSCGPKTGRSPEVSELAKHGWLKEVRSGEAFAAWVRETSGRFAPGVHVTNEQAFDRFLLEHRGASARIIDICEGGKNESNH